MFKNNDLFMFCSIANYTYQNRNNVRFIVTREKFDDIQNWIFQRDFE